MFVAGPKKLKFAAFKQKEPPPLELEKTVSQWENPNELPRAAKVSQSGRESSPKAASQSRPSEAGLLGQSAAATTRLHYRGRRAEPREGGEGGRGDESPTEPMIKVLS
eukprot:1194167-Prorocentrum_minimum.AAC.1